MPRPLDSEPIHALAAPDAQHDPLVHTPLSAQRLVFWYEPLQSRLAGHADCTAVLRDNARFSTDWTRVGETVPPAARVAWRAGRVLNRSSVISRCR